jgi:chitodextrinase
VRRSSKLLLVAAAGVTLVGGGNPAFAAVDVTPPTVTSVSPPDGSLYLPTSTVPTVTFSEPVQPATIKYMFTDPFGVNIAGTAVYSSATRTAQLPAKVLLLSPAKYTMKVWYAQDLKGNTLKTAKTWTFSTGTAPDTTAPTAPGTPVAGTVTPTTVDLTWPASTDTVGVTKYDVLNGETVVATVTGNPPATATTVSGLTGSTAYSFAVRAEDATGNRSAVSAAVSVTTPAPPPPPDTTAPTAPGVPVLGYYDSTSASLTWAEATDGTGVTEYQIMGGPAPGTVTGAPPAAAATLTGLAPSTAYSITVLAKDAAGNVSAASTALSFTTLAVGELPGSRSGAGIDGSTGRTLILYDSTGPYAWLGESYATLTANLSSHFGAWTAMPVTNYRAGQLSGFGAVVYIGSTYDEPIPLAFLDTRSWTRPRCPRSRRPSVATAARSRGRSGRTT